MIGGPAGSAFFTNSDSASAASTPALPKFFRCEQLQWFLDAVAAHRRSGRAHKYPAAGARFMVLAVYVKAVRPVPMALNQRSHVVPLAVPERGRVVPPTELPGNEPLGEVVVANPARQIRVAF